MSHKSTTVNAYSSVAFISNMKINMAIPAFDPSTLSSWSESGNLIGVGNVVGSTCETNAEYSSTNVFYISDELRVILDKFWNGPEFVGMNMPIKGTQYSNVSYAIENTQELGRNIESITLTANQSSDNWFPLPATTQLRRTRAERAAQDAQGNWLFQTGSSGGVGADVVARYAIGPTPSTPGAQDFDTATTGSGGGFQTGGGYNPPSGGAF